MKKVMDEWLADQLSENDFGKMWFEIQKWLVANYAFTDALNDFTEIVPRE